MATSNLKHMQKIARESARLARKSLQKSDELETLLSAFEYRSGKVREYKSVADLFRKLKVA